MPYYAGDHQRYRVRLSGRMYRMGDPGLFSRFSFKKLFKAVGKVGKPLLGLAGSVAGALVPGVGTLVSKGTELLAKARGAVSPALDAISQSQLIQQAAGAQIAFADPTGVAGAIDDYAAGTPGVIAAQAGGRVSRGRKRRSYVPRARRRRRRY